MNEKETNLLIMSLKRYVEIPLDLVKDRRQDKDFAQSSKGVYLSVTISYILEGMFTPCVKSFVKYINVFDVRLGLRNQARPIHISEELGRRKTIQYRFVTIARDG